MLSAALAISGEIGSFQRKNFGNLSHAANKAMNLNVYLGLMGGRWRVAPVAGEQHLVPATAENVPPISQYR